MSETNAVEFVEPGGEVVRFEGLQHKTIEEIKADRRFKKQFVNQLLKKGKYGEGADYGEAGGVKGMVFLETIEEIMSAFYLLAGEPVPTVIDRTIHVEINGEMKTVPHFAVRIKLPIYDLKTNIVVGWGTGRCSTLESKYRYTTETKKCPKCGKETIFVNKFKGKKDRSGKISKYQWYCWKERGGCGSQFMEDDAELKEQEAGKAERINPDDVADTVEFMAEKRALVKIILRLTGMRRYLKLPDELKDKGQENYSDDSKQRENVKEQSQEKRPEGPIEPQTLEDKVKSLENYMLAEMGEPGAITFIQEKSGNEITKFSEIQTDAQYDRIFKAFGQFIDGK
jgi:hypothetical protein